LKGHIQPGNEIFDNDFIGNWQEEGFTFLFFSRPAFNQVKNRILAVQGKVENLIDMSSDLMIANIHLDVIRGLISFLVFMRKNGFFIRPVA
jgi:hypothetical protein